MTLSLTMFKSAITPASLGNNSAPLTRVAERFPSTGTVGRSPAEGQITVSARTILTFVSPEDRHRLISEYAERRGGQALFERSEMEPFLAFLAARLPSPSHALTLCYLGQALDRAQSGAEAFVRRGPRTIRARIDRPLQDHIEREVWECVERGAPTHAEPEVREHIAREFRRSIEFEAWRCIERAVQGRVERGQYATLILFHAEPATVLQMLDGGPVPPIETTAYPMLFGPGVKNFYRAATPDEAALWDRLPTPDAEPNLVRRLLAEGVVRYTE